MINESCVVPEDDKTLDVLEGVSLSGKVNVDDDVLLTNVRSAIRRPYPQIRPGHMNPDRIVLVGGGPSLKDTEDELADLVADGAALVTVNGAYHWCLERHLFPKTQIVMDARTSNARFVEPAVPRCRYVLASQCAPETWDAVEGRPDVWMFHAAGGSDGPLKALLDAHYLGQWFGVGGGVTVVTRAIMLLRAAGYLRFDLFGVDSCFMHGEHHAYAQAENQQDRAFPFVVHPTDRPDLARTFQCAPWHAKQFECFLQMIRVNGSRFILTVHGDGLLAYALSSCADGGIEYHTQATDNASDKGKT
jgi:6-hydroxymethylpterin diphosphokinase MptE-like